MARRVFFSFHYENDIFRVNQIRNSWVIPGREVAGFWDAAAWEQVKRGGDAAIKRWINDQLDGVSVTVVLIGQHTADRKYVLYELTRSFELRKGILGIKVHNMKDVSGYTSLPGRNPLDELFFTDQWGQMRPYSSICLTYDWTLNDGYSNFATWIEAAARAAGR